MFGLRRLWGEDADSVLTVPDPRPTNDVVGPSTPSLAGTVDDEAIDAFVQVLRATGRHAFDVEHESRTTFSQQCEAWARHILILAPAPVGGPSADAGSPTEDVTSVAGRATSRDWSSVVKFVVGRRKREEQHVNKSLSDLRQGMWTFAQSLGNALIEDQESDSQLSTQIERLKVAVERLSPEELKQEIASTAFALSKLVSERQVTQRQRLASLGEQVSVLTGQLLEARQETVRDPLTQLSNRRGFDEFVNRMVFMRDVFAETACLMMVDVDHFKQVNDTHGHAAGDAVLRAIADCMSRNFPRKSDLVARHGGEEFAVILPDTSVQDGKRLAERLLGAIRQLPVQHEGRTITVTVSVGVRQLGRNEAMPDWVQRTDHALYAAKTEGRNRVAEAAAPAL
jgi:diguanylate cyclase